MQGSPVDWPQAAEDSEQAGLPAAVRPSDQQVHPRLPATKKIQITAQSPL